MTQNSLRTHPLMVITATTVILTCLIAIGVMTGIVPSPMAKDRAAQENAAAPAERVAPAENRPSARASAAPSKERERTAERPAAGSTSGAAGGSVAGAAPSAPAVCNNCGTVTSVRVVKQQGEAGLVGPIAGGAVGGLVGSQIGGGSGKTLATIVGAAGGAAVGTEAERRYKATTSYVVGVRLNNGTTRSFTYGNAPGVQQGDRVRVVDGRLIRDS
jgi:outer membrane lipoprotein SlyB